MIDSAQTRDVTRGTRTTHQRLAPIHELREFFRRCDKSSSTAPEDEILKESSACLRREKSEGSSQDGSARKTSVDGIVRGIAIPHGRHWCVSKLRVGSVAKREGRLQAIDEKPAISCLIVAALEDLEQYLPAAARSAQF